MEVMGISVYTDKDSYGKGDVIKISGEIQSAGGMTVSQSIPVTIKIASDILQKPTVALKTYPSTSGNFAINIPTNNSSWNTSDTYTVTASYGNIAGYKDNAIFSFEVGDKNLLSPLKQYELGIPPDKIECRSDLQIIMKPIEKTPACVTLQTYEILVERGWTTPETSSPESPIKFMNIAGLNVNYTVGQQINAEVNFTGYMSGGLYPNVKILNTNNGSEIWSNCIPSHSETASASYYTGTYNVQCFDAYPVINETGTYTMIASLDNKIASAKFTVKPLLLPDSFEPCNTPYPQNGTGVAVLYMPVNSTGKICVRYHTLDDFTASVSFRIFEANNMAQDATDIITWNDSENNTIPIGNSTIVYWIKTGSHAGFYELSLFCGGLPFAVGYDNNSTLVAKDFPYLGGTIFCPAQTYDYHIDSMTGIGVKYIPQK